MNYHYYLDESGNSGDLINKKLDLNFGNQPIFTLACVGLLDVEKTKSDIDDIRIKHSISDLELKSSTLYFQCPELFSDIFAYLNDKQYPILVELVDKKYCVATHIVNYYIIPHMADESNGMAQFIRNGIADYITHHLPDECFLAFFSACNQPSEASIIAAMEKTRDFFSKKIPELDFAELTVKSINLSIDDYFETKEEYGETVAINKFSPIPDKTKTGQTINILPHVHSVFNLLARLNQLHNKNMNKVNLHHDLQNEFENIIVYSKNFIEQKTTPYNGPPVFNSDYNFTKKVNLDFLDSKSHVGIQIADLIAGFMSRYINGWLYKNSEIPSIYHESFSRIVSNYNNIRSQGVNFVIPQSKQQIIFRKHNL